MSHRSELSEFACDPWRFTLPSDWEVVDGADPPLVVGGGGALQFSRVEKESGAVLPEEALEFAEEEASEGKYRVTPIEPRSSEIKGFELIFCEDGIHWGKWWLYFGSHLLFVSFNSEEDALDIVRELILGGHVTL